MKRFVFGLISGLFVGAIVYFAVVPGTRDKAEKAGYDKGVTEGTISGIAQGKLDEKKYEDSLAANPPKPVDTVKPVVKHEPRKPAKNKFDVNYTMNGNSIGEEKK